MFRTVCHKVLKTAMIWPLFTEGNTAMAIVKHDYDFRLTIDTP